MEAKEEFNRLQTSLLHNNYRIPLVGFGWDSKVLWEPAKINATKSGKELANFINKFKTEQNCPTTNIRILAHSLGAAVVNSTIFLNYYFCIIE
jgi:esterase/lipase superfamily enzyme